MVVDVMVKFEPCEYTRKMIFRSVTQSLIKKIIFLEVVYVYFDRAVFTWLSKGIGFGFGFGFTTPFGWLVYLLWFWFYDSQVKTALFTSSFLFSRLKKASGPQRIYFLVYTLLDVVVVVVVTMDLKLGWTLRWRAATGNKNCPIWGAYISPVQPTSSARRDGEKAECGSVSRTWVFCSCFRLQNIFILTEYRFNLFPECLVYFKW